MSCEFVSCRAAGAVRTWVTNLIQDIGERGQNGSADVAEGRGEQTTIGAKMMGREIGL